jgi:hypothetical protein
MVNNKGIFALTELVMRTEGSNSAKSIIPHLKCKSRRTEDLHGFFPIISSSLAHAAGPLPDLFFFSHLLICI